MKAQAPPGAFSSYALSGLLAGAALAVLDFIAAVRGVTSAAEAALLLLANAGALLAPGLLLGLVAGLLARLLPRRPHTPAGLWAILALVLFYLDSRAYRRLYPGPHALLLVSEGTALLLALRSLIPPVRRGVPAAALVAIAAAVGAQAALARSPQVRFLAYQETTAARQVLSLLARLGPRSAPSRPAQRAPERVAPRPPEGRAAPAQRSLPDLQGAHLVLVTVDALRADRLTARRGGRPLMPRLAALAARGAAFQRAYAAAPHTAFSLGSLLTANPLLALTELRATLPPTVAQHLEEQGYRTRAVLPDGLFFNGRRQLAPYVRSHFGFAEQRFHDGTAQSATALAQAVLDEVRQDGEPSTFLWVHYFDPHEPYVRHEAHDFGIGTAERYDSEVALVDEEIGRLHEALGRLLRPVVLVLTADHGEEFNDHGGYYHGSSLYEEQARVPLVILVPGLAPLVISQAVGLVDVAPTLLALLGQPPLPGAAGRDLSPLLLGQPLPERPVVAEVDTRRMVVLGGWKLIHDQLRDTWELYDLKRDPLERRNEYARRPEVATRLVAALYEWLDEVHQTASEPPPIARGRIGDRRALPELAALLRDEGQPAEVRAEAARLIGALEGTSERAALVASISDTDLRVRAEAALSLAYIFDTRAVPVLLELLAMPDYRHRAAIQLGRLRRPEAVPALIDALASPAVDLRRQAAVYLGRVGGAEAVAPLLRLEPDIHAAKDAALALGRIGARAGAAVVLEPLLSWLGREQRDDVVAELCHALAVLGDPQALPALVAVLQRAPTQSWAAEAIVRLGALEQRQGLAGVGGVDLGPQARGLAGFKGCVQRDRTAGEEQLGGGTCVLAATAGRLRFDLEATGRPALLLLRLRPGALDLRRAKLTLVLNGHPLAPLAMLPGWQEITVPLDGRLLRSGGNLVELRVAPGPVRGPRLVVDRLLLVPAQG